MTAILWAWAAGVTVALGFTAWAFNRALDELSKEPCPRCGYDPSEHA